MAGTAAHVPLVNLMTREQAIWYLSAIIDGEGTIDRSGRAIHISNTDDGVLSAVEQCCDVLGYHYTSRYRNNGTGYQRIGHITISRRDTVERAAEDLQMQGAKQHHLRAVALSYDQARKHRTYVE
jgi:hypothetical protein